MSGKDANMQTFDNAKAIARAPRLVTDPKLQNLLYDRVQDWAEAGLLNLTHLALIEVGDTEESIMEALGFSPLVNWLDGKRYGTDGFIVPFDLLLDHEGYFELVMTVGNDGFAFVIFVRDRDGVEPQLRAMCGAYADRGQEAGS
jgi:hypothetical protein